MIVTIQPSILSGIIHAPASKSSMQRACAAAFLTNGKSIIHNPGHSNDDKAAMDIIARLGAKVRMDNGELIIQSEGVPFTTHGSSFTINCGESGLSIRMFVPIVALSKKEITINGEGSLLTRPMDFFDEVLPKLGVKIKSNDGKLPLIIQGPLQPANIEVDGSLSSQFLTGLLMAYGAVPYPFEGGVNEESAAAKIFSIKVKNLKSKPYIDLTLNVMKKFGLNVPENRNYEEFIFYNDSSKVSPPTGGGNLEGASYTVEGDWSGGAFLLVAGAIAGPIAVRGLDLTSTQADKAIMDSLIRANAGITINAKGINIHPAQMTAFNFDATDCPDLFPPLVALAAYCKGITKINGVNRLTYKESNRALTLQEEFGKMGVKIKWEDDVMLINSIGKVKGSRVHSHHDHRIAMACTVAALNADGEMIIEEAQAVNKSYPDFFNDLKILKAEINNQFSLPENQGIFE